VTALGSEHAALTAAKWLIREQESYKKSGAPFTGNDALMGNFHESYATSEIKPPSERSTGLVFTAVAVIVAILWRNSASILWLALGMAATFAAFSLIAPALLKPVNILWFKFGLLIHRVVNPIAIFAVYAAVFVPTGAIMRLWRDPLQSRRKMGASSYWIERRKEIEGSMANQF
jgi:hypothetical protein